METITVNGKTYYSEPANHFEGDIKIVILQRGWVMIGRFEKNGSECKLHDASVIRNWGTTKGLGESFSNITFQLDSFFPFKKDFMAYRERYKKTSILLASIMTDILKSAYSDLLASYNLGRKYEINVSLYFPFYVLHEDKISNLKKLS